MFMGPFTFDQCTLDDRLSHRVKAAAQGSDFSKDGGVANLLRTAAQAIADKLGQLALKAIPEAAHDQRFHFCDVPAQMHAELVERIEQASQVRRATLASGKPERD